ncbi:ankyrin repeat and SAM domain-containing protein 3-like [Papaver somniferum]|nr:ankyrin repeat and SAM domain-containing protein 3-like [Papaver somniferum]
MLLLGMNSKRQRRPNVRLNEIGDVSAAVSSFTSSHRPNQNLEENYPGQSFYDPIYGYPIPSSEFMEMDHGPAQNDTQQNRENWNPNSSKSPFDFTCSDEGYMSKPKLDFGVVTKRGRVMKRRGRSTRVYSGLAGGAWSSRLSPAAKSNSFDGSKLDVYFDDGYTNRFDDSMDRHTSKTDKEEAWEDYLVDPAVSESRGGDDSDETLSRDAYENPETENPETVDAEDDPYTDPESGCGNGNSNIGFPVRVINSVSDWLEGLGFSKYVDIFEMHEVDEDALPLLTLEDLKEMGVDAVGPRRKLYNAIRLLREEDSD